MRSRPVAVVLGLIAALLVFAQTGLSAAATPTNTQTCPVPLLGLDPDSVTLTGPVISPVSTGGPLATASVTASETPAELGPGAPTVRLFVYRSNGASPVQDLLNGLQGPSTSGGASLSGPATGSGMTTETITFSAPGTYVFDFIVLFDSGIHPCTSLLPPNHSLVVTVPSVLPV
jgi:hypothetical protein